MTKRHGTQSHSKWVIIAITICLIAITPAPLHSVEAKRFSVAVKPTICVLALIKDDAAKGLVNSDFESQREWLMGPTHRAIDQLKSRIEKQGIPIQPDRLRIISVFKEQHVPTICKDRNRDILIKIVWSQGRTPQAYRVTFSVTRSNEHISRSITREQTKKMSQRSFNIIDLRNPVFHGDRFWYPQVDMMILGESVINSIDWR